jgi:outer membrane protein assembly factor BamB
MLSPTLTFARPALLALVWLATFAAAMVARPVAAQLLVSHEAAARHGLERAWFAQVPLDPSRTRATAWLLYFDTLYSVTDAGIVTALDAETGAERWSRQIGRPGEPAFGPDANQEFLGVVSGTTLYMLRREDGRLEWSRELGSAPSSGPALSKQYAFVALVTGRIEGFKLSDPETQPWYFISRGRTHLRPTTTGRVVSWPTSEGYLYVSDANNPAVKFRLETKADIVTSPAELEPYLYIASLDGYLYCMDEMTGREQWRYSTGYPIMSSPAIVGERAYVASAEPALHCIDAKTGAQIWTLPGISHFAAQGDGRVYASDRFGNLRVVDADTGALLGEMRVAEGLSTLVNDKTDRIFLVNDRGLVQCLREIGATEPKYHRQLEPTAPEDGRDEAQGEEANPFQSEESGEAEANPFDAEAPAEGEPAADADEPAAEAEPDAEPEAEAEDPDENPFGF